MPTQADLAGLIARTVRDERVAGAFAAVPRAAFVPPGHEGRAYVDEPLPIPEGQVTTQPSLVARMLRALELEGSERVLEIGTGYGFQTALLAWLAHAVWSVERFGDLAAAARERLERRGVRNAEVVVGDGTEGLPAHAPYDAIVVSAAFTAVPPPLAQQLAPGGRLVQPIGSGGDEEVTVFERLPDGLRKVASVDGARFVRLVGRHAFPR
jgi:protein-L-isoaspartate(D-aspartate) O-methyltransferase